MQGYKIPLFNFQHLLLRGIILLHVRTVTLFRKLSAIYFAWTNLKNLLEELACKPNIINLSSVSTRSSGKQRLILDLRHVNQFIFKQKFKCEDLSVATQLFSRSYYLFKFDLKSGYHHIEIFPDQRKFLAFAWDFGTGVFRYIHFCAGSLYGSLPLRMFLRRF